MWIFIILTGRIAAIPKERDGERDIRRPLRLSARHPHLQSIRSCASSLLDHDDAPLGSAFAVEGYFPQVAALPQQRWERENRVDISYAMHSVGVHGLGDGVEGMLPWKRGVEWGGAGYRSSGE